MVNPQVDTTSIRERAAQIGESIYEQYLKPLLEPASFGQFVAIHLLAGNIFWVILSLKPPITFGRNTQMRQGGKSMRAASAIGLRFARAHRE